MEYEIPAQVGGYYKNTIKVDVFSETMTTFFSYEIESEEMAKHLFLTKAKLKLVIDEKDIEETQKKFNR